MPRYSLMSVKVRLGDMELFYSAFEHAGLRRGVIKPTYGLAEHTVFVCTNGRQARTLPISTCAVVVVPSTQPLTPCSASRGFSFY